MSGREACPGPCPFVGGCTECPRIERGEASNIRSSIRLCERHAEEWVPDPNEIVCLFCESLVCEGPLVKYVHVGHQADEIERLRAHYHRLSEERDRQMARAVKAEAEVAAAKLNAAKAGKR